MITFVMSCSRQRKSAVIFFVESTFIDMRSINFEPVLESL